MNVLVVDSGLGNLRSVERALREASARVSHKEFDIERSRELERIARADCIVVPGQGGFRDAARALEDGLGEVLLERIRAGVPYLGICLGLQILFESSEEAPGARGLGLFQGAVKRLEGSPELKIPHMGWNQLEVSSSSHPVLDRAGANGAWFYFVHSYHAVPFDRALVKASATYGPLAVTALVARDNVLATQFHPEKSQAAGLEFLSAFLASV